MTLRPAARLGADLKIEARTVADLVKSGEIADKSRVCLLDMRGEKARSDEGGAVTLHTHQDELPSSIGRCGHSALPLVDHRDPSILCIEDAGGGTEYRYGFGRIVASEAEPPNMLSIWYDVDARSCKVATRLSPMTAPESYLL